MKKSWVHCLMIASVLLLQASVTSVYGGKPTTKSIKKAETGKKAAAYACSANGLMFFGLGFICPPCHIIGGFYEVVGLGLHIAADCGDPPVTDVPHIVQIEDGLSDTTISVSNAPPGAVIILVDAAQNFEFVISSNYVSFTKDGVSALSHIAANESSQSNLVTIVPFLDPGMYEVRVTNSMGASAPVSFQVLPLADFSPLCAGSNLLSCAQQIIADHFAADRYLNSAIRTNYLRNRSFLEGQLVDVDALLQQIDDTDAALAVAEAEIALLSSNDVVRMASYIVAGASPSTFNGMTRMTREAADAIMAVYLDYSVTNDAIELKWPSDLGWTLQGASSAPGGWSNVVTVTNSWQVTPTAPLQFFRLNSGP